jgi:hypothetical protein
MEIQRSFFRNELGVLNRGLLYFTRGMGMQVE